MNSALKQRTLKTVIRATGVTVHSGERAELTLRPAPPNTGIVFCWVGSNKIVNIPALNKYVGDTTLSTTLVKENIKKKFQLQKRYSKENICKTDLADLAAKLQKETEDAVVYLAQCAYQLTGSKNICLA